MSTSGFLQGCAVLRGTNGFHPKVGPGEGGMSLLFFEAGPHVIPCHSTMASVHHPSSPYPPCLPTERVWQDSPAPPVWVTKALTLSRDAGFGIMGR